MIVKDNLVGVRVRVARRDSGEPLVDGIIRGLALRDIGFQFLIESASVCDTYFVLREGELFSVHEHDESVVVQVDPRFK